MIISSMALDPGQSPPRTKWDLKQKKSASTEGW